MPANTRHRSPPVAEPQTPARMNLESSVLLTDLYQLTMLKGYFDCRMHETAVFELFMRKMPRARNFLVAAGLEQALAFLEDFRFSPDEIGWLRRGNRFPATFVDFLEKLRFTGDVHAMREGTIFFPDEPILRVTAPLPEAQIVETRLINLVHFQTMIASKAARSVLAAPGRVLVDFGLRRAHGAEAGLLSARASWIAGFSGTSNVLAGELFEIPTYGTMAHSFVQAHDDESKAFENFARANPDNALFLIDTYDTEAGAEKVVRLAPALRQAGIRVNGVRLDSGDLAKHARKVRKILDRGGLPEAQIFASGNLDEYALEKLLAEDAPIDGYGVGTRMNTSTDAPYFDCAYKLEEYAGRPRRKHSEGKSTWPGRKQVHRHTDANGNMLSDTLTIESDAQKGQSLIVPVMRAGKRIVPPEPLTGIRARVSNGLARLPARLRELEPAEPYPVHVADALKDLAKAADVLHSRT
jgi:nicotinate phosphoribosyltransferase